MDPELVSYATSTHNYTSMSHNDQLRLCSIRIELSRIEIGIQRQMMTIRAHRNAQDRSNRNEASCLVCYETFSPYIETVTAFCGHVYCRSCFHRCFNENGCCALCQQPIESIISHLILFIRFNYWFVMTCRHCMREIRSDTTAIATRCGNVFCQSCFLRMGEFCFGCNSLLNSSHRVVVLHLAFN